MTEIRNVIDDIYKNADIMMTTHVRPDSEHISLSTNCTSRSILQSLCMSAAVASSAMLNEQSSSMGQYYASKVGELSEVRIRGEGRKQ